ncbi:MAG TPA: DinB family protein [Gemmatimonadaceae bacterium]|nr:DinB family protein [Gemmatimonadaceae bacterium]
MPPLLQPVAHSLLQCREEVDAKLSTLDAPRLVARPAGAASVAFHLTHAMGSLDRLLTYARGEQLSDAQLVALRAESGVEAVPQDAAALAKRFGEAVERALVQVRGTSESALLDRREVGRGRLPSTAIGLLFHAAEHTQRHVGQAVTTARIVAGMVTQ